MDAIERQRRLTVDLLANLEKCDQQKDRLKSVRSYLTTLATDPGIDAEVKQIVGFGKAVEEQLQKEKKEK